MLCGEQQELAQEKFASVVGEAKRQPYCEYLAFEAVNLAARYIDQGCRLVQSNLDILDQHAAQRAQVAMLLADGTVVERITHEIQKME